MANLDKMNVLPIAETNKDAWFIKKKNNNNNNNITIISKHLWPKSWPIQKISCQITGVS